MPWLIAVIVCAALLAAGLVVLGRRAARSRDRGPGARGTGRTPGGPPGHRRVATHWWVGVDPAGPGDGPSTADDHGRP